MATNNSKIRQLLQQAIEQRNRRAEDEDFATVSKSIASEIGQLITPEQVSQGVVDSLTAKLAPVIQTLLERDRASSADIESVISKIQLPSVNVPEIKIPEIKVPKVNVQVPPIRVPDIIMPEEMGIRGWVNMMLDDRPISLGNPLPVTLRTADGSPMDFLGGGSVVSGGGGKHDFFTIKDIRGSSASLINQTEGALRVVGDLSISSTNAYLVDGDGNYRGTIPIESGSTLEVRQVSGSIDSTNVTQLAGTAVAVNGGVQNDGTLRVTHATDAIVSVNIVSGSSTGTEYADGATAEPGTGTLAMGDTGEESGNIFALRTHSGVVSSGVLRVVHATDVGLSTNVTNTVTVTGTLTSTGAYLLDGDGNYRDEIQVSGITASIAAALVDSGGVQYSSSNPVPIDDAGGSLTVDGTVSVSGSITSTVAVGDIVADAADTGSAPVKIGGIARTANPTAVAAGDRVSATYDDVGRQVMRPMQVRDLMATAYASITTGVETTLLSGVASTFHDLVWIKGANQSDAAVTIDIRETTGGTVIDTLVIPAQSTAGISTNVPYPQANSAGTWTVQNIGTDVSNTSVDITALFSKEV